MNNKYKKILKKVGMMGFVFAAIFAAAWVVLPTSGAEAAFSCDSGLYK